MWTRSDERAQGKTTTPAPREIAREGWQWWSWGLPHVEGHFVPHALYLHMAATAPVHDDAMGLVAYPTREEALDALARAQARAQETNTTNTDLLNRALRDAAEIAARWGHAHVGTEHLLLALARSHGSSEGVFKELGVTAEQVEEVTRRLLGDLIREA